MVARPAIIIVDLLAGMVIYLEDRVGNFHEDILIVGSFMRLLNG